MIDFSRIEVVKIIGHQVGNKLRGEQVNYSSKLLAFDDEATEELFMKFVLSKFNSEEVFRLTHSSALNLNEVYSYCTDVFKSTGDFIKITKDIAAHLYDQSTHPKIKSGEVFIALFKNCGIDNHFVDAIGIFKSETKDSYIKPLPENTQMRIASDKGINIDSLDKGCIVLDVNAEDGYKVCIVNNRNQEDIQYWTEKFLNIIPANDQYNLTGNFLKLTKEFITSDESIPRTEQIDLLNKSLKFFKDNDTFNIDDFQTTVFNNGELIDAFQSFGSQYLDENEMEIPDSFDISAQAVKKQGRVFKSVLKLDKNFHIYIHGDRELIEKGVEKDGRKYYKIYYDEEY